MCSRVSIVFLHLLFVAVPILASYAQFYDDASKVGFALSTAHNETSTDLLFQISAPQQAGWGAVGTGYQMDGSLLFIIYPSSQSHEVTVSVRRASGHDTPAPISDIDFVVQSSAIQNSIMTANVICWNCTQWSDGNSLDMSSTKQPWIYAAGPGQAISSTSQDAYISKHSTYGTFFVDMTATQTDSTSILSVSGTSDVNTTALPGSVGALVVLHAILLGGSFVILFPLGVGFLRFLNSFRLHWMLQVIATMICIVGLGIAVVLSVIDLEYNSFTATHQIIGMLVVAAVVFQAVLGYLHHQNFKKVGRRTWVSYAHLWTGRMVIIVGMVNTVLGFLLARSTISAVGVAIFSCIILVGMFVTNYLGEKRRRAKEFKSVPLRSDVALDTFNHPYSTLGQQ